MRPEGDAVLLDDPPLVTRGSFIFYAGSIDYLSTTVAGCDYLEVYKAVESLCGRSETSVKVTGGYGEAWGLCTADGEFAGLLRWGGSQPHPHISLAGAIADAALEPLCRAFTSPGMLRPTRVDVCRDYDLPGLFDDLTAWLRDQDSQGGLGVESLCMGPLDGKGRTLYVGSPKSAIRVRVYEKGIQLSDAARTPGLYSDSWVRFETQFRPPAPKKFGPRLLLARGEVQNFGRISPKILEYIEGHCEPANYRAGYTAIPPGMMSRADNIARSIAKVPPSMRSKLMLALSEKVLQHCNDESLSAVLRMYAQTQG